MALALTRDKRFNAGNRMSRMLQEEEQDDFYKTTYGGFEEHSGDDEYSSEDSDSDATDSDISVSEDDELMSDDEGKEPKRQRRTLTKAYKEPVTKPAAKKTTHPPRQPVKPKEKEKAPKQQTTASAVAVSNEQSNILDDGNLRKSSRRSTVMKGTEFQIRLKEREERAEINRISLANRSRPEVRRLTQEELLDEARVTEEENLISLQNYRKMEAEKKKSKFHKQTVKGPFIRFHSMLMPEIVRDTLRQSRDDSTLVSTDIHPPPPTQRCSRNFITFSEEAIFKKYFPKNKNRPPSKQLCPVTRQRAMYLDPITNIPYANKRAFKVIREAYESELESQVESKKRKTQPKAN
ncbi:vacuolar protein sorting-associated protein 72 homolog [Asterias rubens]|uniref:vacuolar protein sorting-associated protein 72 homolog n=1 Tax=Asterias rubens TaxID=7604 RepID=UPI001455197B|nr:vacuolar protein sorting-associated protein 72 homolog [Asterias rubens]XP_033624463.1 vacuolar protein sorting-associated protein 72 homolog [Asterias rubens]